jgi:hypothetical protein
MQILDLHERRQDTPDVPLEVVLLSGFFDIGIGRRKTCHDGALPHHGLAHEDLQAPLPTGALARLFVGIIRAYLPYKR